MEIQEITAIYFKISFFLVQKAYVCEKSKVFFPTHKHNLEIFSIHT